MRSYPVKKSPIFKIIKRDHGTEVLYEARKLESVRLNLENTLSKVCFLKRCRDNGILPRSFRMKTGVASNRKAEAIIRRAGFSLLRNTIKEYRKEIAFLTRTIGELRLNLESVLGPDVTSELYRQVEVSALILRDNIQTRLENKFSRLVSYRLWQYEGHIDDRTQEEQGLELNRVVLNLSSRELTLNEKGVLAKGLNFVPTPQKVDYLDLISRVEVGIRHEDHLKANEIRSVIANSLHDKQYRPRMNLSASEVRLLYKLKKDHSIVITKADKGNVVVVLDRKTYEEKVTELLNAGTYAPLAMDPTATVRKELVSLLRDLVDETKEKALSDITKSLKFMTNFVSPELFGLPKIHKENTPLRPVIASGKTVTSQLSSYLATVLKPLTGQMSSHAKNSLAFKRDIKQIELDRDDILVSYDVKDLFTSVPLEMTCNIIQEKLSNDKSLKDRTKLNPYHLKQLVKFCMTEGNYFHWKGSYFKQVNGAPMGSSLSPVFVEMFMEHLEEKAFPRGISNHNLKAFKRYVDDIFAIVRKGSEVALLEHLNSLFPGVISFTMEIEEDGQLPFLDVLVMRKGNHLETKVYRKPTHSDRFLNFSSNHPLSVKLGVITGMVDRAYAICDPEYLEEELVHIRRSLKLNDYPRRLVEKCIRGRLEKLKNRAEDNEARQETNRTKVILPYYPGLGEEIKRAVRSLDILVVFKNPGNLRSILRSDKVKLPPSDRPGALYKVTCGCGASYIGETGHTVEHRFEQHKSALKRYRNAERRQRGERIIVRGRPQTKDPLTIMEEMASTSAIVEHKRRCNCPDETLSVSALKWEQDFRLRKIEEAFYIKSNFCMNRDEGTAVSEVWQSLIHRTGCCSLVPIAPHLQRQ